MDFGLSADLSGNNNHGQYISGADNNAQGRWDTNAGFFGGVDNIVKIGDSSELGGFSEITVMAWVNILGEPGANWGRVVSKPQGATGDDYALTFAEGGHTHRVTLRINTDVATTTEQGDTEIILNSGWHHFAGTWSGGDVVVYLDGEKDCSTCAGNAGTLDDSDEQLTIGNHLGSSTREFNGLIEEVKIYNRSLSAAEISLEYSNGISNRRKCSWDWDITGVADDNYYINIMSKELGYEADFDSADNSFHVVVSAEDSCSCPTGGSHWSIQNSDICTLSTTCSMPTGDLHISSGSLNITQTGVLSISATGKVVVDSGQFLYIEDGGQLIIR